MAVWFGEQVARWLPEVVIPIPLHLWKLPVDTKYLKRMQKTLPQKQLNDRERRENMKTAFKITENDVKYKSVLLIDDIYTTGSTMDAAARILKENGVRKVYFLCISIGSGR